MHSSIFRVKTIAVFSKCDSVMLVFFRPSDFSVLEPGRWLEIPLILSVLPKDSSYAMKAYLFRRLLYTIPVALGVYVITFFLFHLRDPMAIARVHLPQGDEAALQQWVYNHGYHLPRFLNLPADAREPAADGKVHEFLADRSVFYSRFFLGLKDLFLLDLGFDRYGRSIATEMGRRIPVSLAVMGPSFILTALAALSLSVYSAYRAGSRFDRGIAMASIITLSIALPVWLLATTFFFGKLLPILPIYGSVLPAILVAFLAGLGGQVRFYRTVFADRTGAFSVKAARLRGLSEARVIGRYVFLPGLIPVLTTLILSLPFLITGSLLLEQYFGIPGMGDMMYSAIIAQDFEVIETLVVLGAFLFMLGTLMTDIAYVLVDPRMELK